MGAAESIFEGKFDHVKDEDVEMQASAPEPKKRVRQAVSFTAICLA
jgi:hypothetical protein